MSTYECKVEHAFDWEDVEGHNVEDAAKNFCERVDERSPPEGFGHHERPTYVLVREPGGEPKRFRVHPDWVKTFDVWEVA